MIVEQFLTSIHSSYNEVALLLIVFAAMYLPAQKAMKIHVNLPYDWAGRHLELEIRFQ